MQSEHTKPFLFGVILGAVLIWIIGFWALGWVGAGNAEKLATERSQAAVTAALTPYCVATAQADPEFEERLAAIKAQSSANTNRSSVESFGWATAPNSTSPNRAVATNCVTALQALD